MHSTIRQPLVSGLLAAIAACLLVLAYLIAAPITAAPAADLTHPAQGSTFVWNIAEQTTLAPVFFSTETTLTKYPSAGGSYTVAGITGSLETTPVLAGRGPHGGYDTTTFKCQTCHSAHGAGYQGTALLRDGQTGCEFCHLGSSVASSKSVYQSSGGDPFDLSSAEATNSGHQLGHYDSVANSSLTNFDLTCGSCHSVHAASSELWKPADFFQNTAEGQPIVADTTSVYGYKLLKADPSRLGSAVATWAASSSPATDPATVNQFALSIWCLNCHNQNVASATHSLGLGDSHETTFTLAGTTDAANPHEADLATGHAGPHVTVVEGIYNGPTQCYTCHRGNLSMHDEGLDPNDTTQNALLTRIVGTGVGYYENKVTDQSKLDCAHCHYGTADYAADVARLNGTSDWPHSSTNDFALLGNWSLNASDPYSTTELMIDLPDGSMDQNDIPQYLCGRCHITTDGVNFTFSHHSVIHTFVPLDGSWDTTGTTGQLGTYYSPGYVAP